MGEIDTVAELQKDNPRLRAVDLRVFADALTLYQEAAKNLHENGAVVAHPRTGTPIENPYLKIQTAKGAVLAKMRMVKCDRVMEMLAAE